MPVGPYPQRFVVLGRAPNPPVMKLGEEKVIPRGAGDTYLAVITEVLENGDVRAVGGGKTFLGTWARVLDNDQGLTLTCWRWRDDK